MSSANANINTSQQPRGPFTIPHQQASALMKTLLLTKPDPISVQAIRPVPRKEGQAAQSHAPQSQGRAVHSGVESEGKLVYLKGKRSKDSFSKVQNPKVKAEGAGREPMAEHRLLKTGLAGYSHVPALSTGVIDGGQQPPQPLPFKGKVEYVHRTLDE